MSLNAKASEFFRVMGEAATIVPALGYKMAEDDEKVSLGALFEDTVSSHPDNVMLIFEGRQWTYSEFNDDVNQLARYTKTPGQLLYLCWGVVSLPDDAGRCIEVPIGEPGLLLGEISHKTKFDGHTGPAARAGAQ